MKRIIWLMLFAISCGKTMEGLIDGRLLLEPTAQYSGQDAFSCETFETSCQVLPEVIAQNSGVDIFTDPSFSVAAGVMNSIIAQNSGTSIWPASTAIVFGDRNYMAAVNVNNSTLDSNFDVEYGVSPLIAAGSVQISLMSDVIPFEYDAVHQYDVMFTTNADSVGIQGDTVIYGALALNGGATFTVDGSLYLFAGGDHYLDLNGGTLNVTGNLYLNGNQEYALFIDGSVNVSGDVFIFNHRDTDYDGAAVTINSGTLSCANLFVVNNLGSDAKTAFFVHEDATILATQNMHICGNSADQDSGTGSAVAISGSLTATGNINISANVGGTDVNTTLFCVIINSTATLSAEKIIFAQNLGMTAGSFTVYCESGSFASDQEIYSVNNRSNGGTGFRYNGISLHTEGLSSVANYTGPVPQVPFGGTPLSGSCTNADIPEDGDMVIVGGSLSLTDSATIHGNLVIVASGGGYLSLDNNQLTVLGDVILDGANSFAGTDGNWLGITGQLLATGNITMQNNYHFGADTTMPIDAASIIGGPEGTQAKSVNVVGNAVGSSTSATLLGMAGTITNVATCNFVGNTLSTTQVNPSNTKVLNITGTITATEGINFLENSANAGTAVLLAQDASVEGGSVNFIGNSVEYTTTGGGNTGSVYGVAIINSSVTAAESQNITMLGNGASSVATGQSIAVAVGLDGSGTVAVQANQINMVGNIASADSSGFTAAGVAVYDTTGSSSGSCGFVVENGMNVVANYGLSQTDYDATNSIYGFVLGAFLGTNSSTYSITSTGNGSKINVIGNYGFQDYGVYLGSSSLMYNSGNNGQINFAINNANIFNDDGIGISIIDNAGVVAPQGFLYWLANSGYDNGIACNTTNEITANVVDAYCVQGPALCYNGEGFGDTNYTGGIPPVGV